VKTKYIFISIPILLILLFVFNTWRTNNLRKSGIVTQGNVIQVTKISYKDNERSHRKIEYYQVEISFIVDGSEIKGSKEIIPAEYDLKKLIKGDVVDIIYDPENPTEFILGE